MLHKASTQNGVTSHNLANDSGQRRISLSMGRISDKRITFVSLCALVLLTIFGLVYRTSRDSVLDFAHINRSLPSDPTPFPTWISGSSKRPRRQTPIVRATPNQTLTETPTMSVLPTPAITSTPTSTLTPAVTSLSAATSTTTSTLIATSTVTTSTPTATSTSATTTSTTTEASSSSTVTSTLITTSTTTTASTSTLPKPTSSSAPSAIPLRTTPLRSQTVTRRPDDVSRYVSFSGGFADGRGLGNQIFCFAAVLYVAQLTGREPAIEKFNYVIQLDEVFDLKVERFDSLCPCSLVEESKHLAFDEETDNKVLNSQQAANKSILVGGFRQSWRYTLAIERRLRRHLVFKEKIRKFAEEYLDMHIPPGWIRAGFLRVAIHVRRGDILLQRLVDYGYTAPSASYFKKAMKYFTERYIRVQFVTFTEDPRWVRENIHADSSHAQSVNVTHSFGHSTGQDLAIMSMCDHVIMSTGTFGWWGAWLAKGTTIYFSDWPRNGSGLEKQFKKEDFFPPSWIPMTD